MDFTRIRTSMPWRGQAQAQAQAQTQDQHQQTLPDLEQQALPQTTDLQEETRNNLRLFSMSRPTIPSRFSLRSSWATSRGRGREPGPGAITNEVVSSDEDDDDDGPKSPMPAPATAPNRFRLPSLSRYSTRTRDGATDQEQYPDFDPERQNQEGFGEQQQQQQRRSRPLSQRFPILTRPLAVRTNRATATVTEDVARQGGNAGGRTRFDGSDPAELHLAGLAETGRRRQQYRRREQRRRGAEEGSRRVRSRKGPPKRFLFCFPWVKSRRARGLILRCFVSGLFLVCMLTVYLSLSITKNINTSEFTILLILLILLTTLFFCHGLIRLCMLLVGQRNRRGESERERGGADVNISGGYAIPAQPIRVLLARDEEAAGIESETTKMTPPAYGIWRESVRVDPDRIYWQRAETPKLPSSTSSPNNNTDNGNLNHNNEVNPGDNTQHRPPSYISDDGVDYVVDARPRSIAPPPSSVYSQPSAIGTPMTSVSYLMGEVRDSNIPPLPAPLHPALTRPGRPLVAGAPGNWSMV